MSDYCIVMTTFAKKKHARTVIDEVLKKNLAACAQVRKIKSDYHWKGKLHHKKERFVWFKTKKSNYEKLAECIHALHPYEVPELISVDINNGSREYLEWIGENTIGN